MDTLRGTFDPDGQGDRAWDAFEDEAADSPQFHDVPPELIGSDERRMQVRAYNHWAGLAGDRQFPNITDLDPADIAEFGPHSVLLDFTEGPGNPAVRFLGDKLGVECGAVGIIDRLSDVPSRSLLSRITDHYMQILAHQAPIGFEAEFINHVGLALLYRGILLPYSSDDRTIDYIYGVINWKEMADQLTADELLLEIDQALELEGALELTAEAAGEQAPAPAPAPAPHPAPRFASLAERYAMDSGYGAAAADEDDEDGALPDFSAFDLDEDEYDEDEVEDESAGYNFASLADYIETPFKKAIDLTALNRPAVPVGYAPPAPAPVPVPVEYTPGFAPEFASARGTDEGADDESGFAPHGLPAFAATPLAEPGVPEDAPVSGDASDPAPVAGDLAPETRDPALTGALHDWLAAARDLARAADSTEDRSRSALYAAVSRAYDFSLAAQAAPEEYAALIADAGLVVQERAPMTPVVKLVFGPDYDKTRLTEYAAVLTHAHRLGLACGSLAGFLSRTVGGVKAIVRAERELRRGGQDKPVEDAVSVREALAKALRALEALTLDELDGAGPEFALALVRRDEIGCAQIVAEVPEDIVLLERAARKIVG
jgi:hypothetical protein